jgi:high-affinity Fe2+/Pb2+ permease
MLVTKGAVMGLTQAFLLGMMVAWTPSMIVLALMLREQG